MEEKPQKPMSIEQAGNYLTEKRKTAEEDIKAEVKKNPISVAPAGDRFKYLQYGLSLMEDISEHQKILWCTAARRAPNMYTTKEVCELMKKHLFLRMNGYSNRALGRVMGAPESSLNQCEVISIDSVKIAIGQRIATSTPIVGG
jgi:hypothetical protein